MRIMIIDYKPLVLSTMGDFLRDFGHEVLTAESATEAVKRENDGKPVDVILLDAGDSETLVMRALSSVHERYPEADIVLMTPERLEGDFALENGVFAFFRHPYHLSELEVVLGRIGEKRELQGKA